MWMQGRSSGSIFAAIDDNYMYQEMGETGCESFGVQETGHRDSIGILEVALLDDVTICSTEASFLLGCHCRGSYLRASKRVTGFDTRR